MSSEAGRFVRDGCTHIKPQLKYTLLMMAQWADKDGRNMWPSMRTLAKATGKSRRQTEKDVAELLALGELARGDQSQVAHIDPWDRPVVYNLAKMPGLASVTPEAPRRGKKAPVSGPCTVHAGQKAATCGPCRSERIAAG